MLTIRRAIALVCVLLVLGIFAWVYGWLWPPYEAEAELLVRPRSELELMIAGRSNGVLASADDSWAIAQNVSKLISSHTVIIAGCGETRSRVIP